MAEFRAQRRLAAILAADVAGYSRLMEQDEAGTLAALKTRRNEVLVPTVAQHSGRVVKVMGDGVLVEFGSAVDAVQCAVELQKGFARANQGVAETSRIVLRIGINLGDVIVEGSDLYGDGVNIAARLEALAEPGGICVSRKVHDEVQGKIDTAFTDLGEQAFKNITALVRVYRLRQRAEVSAARPALALPDKPSIAVLPFANMSNDLEQEYFADGIVEEIITALSRFDGLFVIARNSSFVYKGRAVDVKQIGRELGVRYVLEGSVRKAGNKLRITGQLIDASTGAHLWANRFDGELEDIFDLQDDVTANVVGAIAPKIEKAEIDRSRLKPTENLDAYDYYLRGTAAMHLWTREANDEALAHFDRAIELDPNFAAAHGVAARCYVMRRAARWVNDYAQEMTKAVRLARRTVELGPNDAVALCNAGFALTDLALDFEGGDAVVERALVLNPNLAWAWLCSSWSKISLGEPDTALERVARAMRLSPQDPQIFSMQNALAMAYFVGGRYDEAISAAEIAIRERPNFVLPNCTAATSAALAGRIEDANKFMVRVREIAPELSLANLKEMVAFRQSEIFDRWTEGLRKAGLPE